MKQWEEIMAELTGARLAVLDTLMVKGTSTLHEVADHCPKHSEEAIEAALRWLRAHHFVRAAGAGVWDSRTIAAAQNFYTAAGGAIEEFMREPATGATTARPMRSAPAPIFHAANEAPSGIRVHDYQASLFDL